MLMMYVSKYIAKGEPNIEISTSKSDCAREVQKMKVGVFWWTSPGAPKKKLTSIFGVKSKKMELFSCK